MSLPFTTRSNSNRRIEQNYYPFNSPFGRSEMDGFIPALPWIHGSNLCCLNHSLAAKSVLVLSWLFGSLKSNMSGGIWRHSPCCEHVSLTKFTQNVGFLSHRKHSFLQHTTDIPTPKWWNKVSRNLYSWPIDLRGIWIASVSSVNLPISVRPTAPPLHHQDIPSCPMSWFDSICFKHVVLANYSILASKTS